MGSDPVLLTNAAMMTGWGALTTVAPKKTCKLYYDKEPSMDTVGVTRWLGWGYLCQATSLVLMDKYGDAKMKKAAKKMMTAANAYALAQTYYQTENNGLNKKMALGSAAIVGGVMAANVADLMKKD